MIPKSCRNRHDLKFSPAKIQKISHLAQYLSAFYYLCTDEEDTKTSVLLMPNAFSPNGDGINDIYKPKEGYQNIKEFHAYIYNRWGQKLFEWSDPATGWDGTYKGKPVKEGVYFCLVKAKGADGKTYQIKRDVNLLRGYTTEQYSNN